MRRCLHSLLVGILTFSLSIDAARACGHLRHWRACHATWSMPTVVVTDVVACDPCGVPWGDVWGAAFVTDACGAMACGCDAGVVVAGGLAGCEEIARGQAVECCGAVEPAVDAVVAAPAAESILTPAPAAGVTKATPPAAEPLASAVPELAPVEPVAATEPAAEPLTPPEPAATELTMPAAETTEPALSAEPTAEEPVAMEPEPSVEPEPALVVAEERAAEPPPRANVFEQADAPLAEPEAARPGIETKPAADEPVDSAVEPVEPVITESTETEPEFGADAADEPVFEEPAMEEPVMDEAEPIEPAVEPEPTAAVEPLRRWIDDTASYAVVGRFVGVDGGTVEIVKADGRIVTVPLDRLSGFDRDYVADAGPRVAAARAPHPRETARR